MAGFKFLLDADVRHLASCFPQNQTLQVEDLGLDSSASDEAIIEAAEDYLIVTNNRRDYETGVVSRINMSSKKRNGCTQIHGLVIVLPSTKEEQVQAIKRASKQLLLDGRPITWKIVHEECLKVIIESNGNARVTRLPRCPHCAFQG
jgi:hypothetical protein